MENSDVEQNTGKEEFVSIRRDTLGEMIKRSGRLAQMVLLLTHVCELRKVQMTLTAEEICRLLGIAPEQFERCRDKRWIKSINAEGTYIYKAYDLALLAERLNRRKVLRALSGIPSLPCKAETAAPEPNDPSGPE